MAEKKGEGLRVKVTFAFLPLTGEKSKETASHPFQRKGPASFGDHDSLREEGFKSVKELLTKT